MKLLPLLRTSAIAATVLLSSLSSAHAAAPRKVAILIFEGVQMIDFSGPLEVFSDAGYEVFTVAATLKPVATAAGPGLKLIPRYTFANAPQADLVVVPGGNWEAKKDTPTTAWIRRQTEHAEHTLSVCNGAFTLAATGLLDGLEATTTSGNIARFQSTFPKVSVVSDRRVVDNGKILTSGGLSAGIDGALHMVEVFDGHDAAQTVALFIEYDWQPDGHYVRASFADRVLPSISVSALGETSRYVQKGDKVHWEKSYSLVAKNPSTNVMEAFKAAYAKGYAGVGPWKTDSLTIASSTPSQTDLRFEDRDGNRWKSLLTVEPDPSGTGRYFVRLVTDKLG